MTRRTRSQPWHRPDGRGALAAAVLLLSLCASARAAECVMNGRSLEYGGTICLDGTNCTEVHQKWTFLGDKILQYTGGSKDEGIVWYVGKQVDMTTDPQNTLYRRPDRPGQDSAILKAEHRGLDYILTRHNELTAVGEQVSSNLWGKWVVRITDCDTCILLLYEISGNTGTQLHQNTMSENWCRMRQ